MTNRIGGSLGMAELAALAGVPAERPGGVCANCWAVYRARRPRPPSVYCHHHGNVATADRGAWRVLEADPASIRLLRMKDKL